MIHPISLSLALDSINTFLPVQVSSGLFNTTYAIPRATTIPADSTEHKVRGASVAVLGLILQPIKHYSVA